MKRKNLIWFLFVLAVFHQSVFLANAVSRTYDWNVYGDTHYMVSVIVENPQLDSSFDVTVRLTLTSKDSSLDYTETEWMQTILDSLDRSLHVESEKQNQTLVLKDVGDSWQETFTFQISSSEYGVGRGQSIEISVTYKININEIDIPRHMTWNHLGDNTDNLMTISVSIPLLTISELIIVLVIVVIIILIVVRFIFLKIKGHRIREKERLRKEAEKRRREKMIGDSFECPYCRTLYDKKLSKCPQCGAPRKIEH